MLLIFVGVSGPWQRSLIVAQPLRVSDKKRCGAFACSFAWGGDAPMAFRHAGGGRAKRLGPQVLGPRRNDAEAAVQPQRRSWGPDGRSPGLRSSAHVSFRLASEAFQRHPRQLGAAEAETVSGSSASAWSAEQRCSATRPHQLGSMTRGYVPLYIRVSVRTHVYTRIPRTFCTSSRAVAGLPAFQQTWQGNWLAGGYGKRTGLWGQDLSVGVDKSTSLLSQHTCTH